MLDLNKEGLTESELKDVIRIWKGKLKEFDRRAYAYAEDSADANADIFADDYIDDHAAEYAAEYVDDYTDAYDAATIKINQFWKEAVEEVKNA